MYNFTPTFIKRYPDFSREYERYWNKQDSNFKNPFQIVAWAYDNDIPVHFYYNFTDKPVNSKEEALNYLMDENSYCYSLDRKEVGK